MKFTEINISENRWNQINIDFNKLVEYVLSFMKYDGKNKTVSFLLTNDNEIHKINKQFRNMDKPTNVLSFELDESGVLGDIALSYDTIEREAKIQYKTFKNHTIHLVVHGVLHLLGYDHINDSDADKMEALEIQILKSLGLDNPYAVIDRKWYKKPVFYYPMLFLIGCLTACGFAPLYLTIPSIIGLGLLYYLTFDINNLKSGAKAGFCFGVGYAILMLHWLINSFFIDSSSSELFGWLAPIALIGIGIIGGILWGLPVVLTSITKDISWRRPIYFAGFAGLILWARNWVFTGFYWNPYDLILMPYSSIINSVSIIGNLGLSFILIGFIASCAHLFINRKKSNYIVFSIFSVCLILCFFYGYNKISNNQSLEEQSISVRIVQPAIKQKFKWDSNKVIENLKKHIDLSNLPQKSNIDLLIWSESSYPYILKSDTFNITKYLNVKFDKIVFGAISQENNLLYNSIITADKSGNILYNYKKHHLVPFGEYNPFAKLGLDKLVPIPGNLSSGNGPVLYSITPDFSVSFSSCYEIIFSSGNIKKGTRPNAIINLTNDGWFGHSFGPFQHLDIAKSMAIETGIPIIRANYSGISAVIDSNGRIKKSLNVGESGIIDVNVPSDSFSLFNRIGNNFIILIIVMILILINPKFWKKLKHHYHRHSIYSDD